MDWIPNMEIGMDCYKEAVVYIQKYRPTSICQTCLSWKPHLFRSDVQFPNIISYVLLYFDLACVKLAYHETSALSKWFSFPLEVFN